MNIKSRILSRKIVFLYFYQKFFTEYLSNEDILFNDILKVDKIVNYENMSDKDLIELRRDIAEICSFSNLDMDISYLHNQFFGNYEINLDFDYISIMILNFSTCLEQLEKLINENIETFEFSSMDMVDKIIFILGFTEKNLINTPKNVILNEMIMLAKIYGDNNSYKLINGIGHKIIS
ncbi:transcription antitermination factor NusB [Candidatus Vampirococcus lugosii]|uniref:Transcription antitermination protein NusB n=1 Tax=Candidatus Vampirococcus lugosii TaxID=2789015 RepID=A0ABS5QMU5_9BACT|nr:transcription antitermination factor NusB [Candidatus Vampirococcus lugosii]MBS8122531.1 transcription antitermination protein NusB [Candidatus Vampirococcus lugosii]